MSIDIAHLIARGEGINIEFKTCAHKLTKDVYETVCAFLNRTGGHILLGVDDNGEVLGVEASSVKQIKKDFITTINNPQKISPALYTNMTEHLIDGKTVLYIPVPNSSQVHRLSGRIYDRNEDADIDITDSTSTVAELYNRKNGIYTEIKVFPYAGVEDLDSERIEYVRKMARTQVSDKPHLWETLSDLELLKSANLYGKDLNTGKDGLNLAGILLLGSEQLIASALPHHKTDAILRVENLDRYDDRDDIRVNLIDSYDRLMAFIAKHLNDPFYIEGTQRVSIRNRVFREVCSNLLIHREFSNAYPAKLIIENGQVRTENANRPNGYGEMNPNNFSPFSKNPIISKFFHEIGLADELGSGFKNLTKYVPLYSGGSPQMVEGNIFTITIPIPDENVKTRITIPDTTTDTTTVTTTDTATDTATVISANRIDMILSFCTIPRSRLEIQDYLGLKNKMHFIRVYLAPLIKSDLISMTVPDKPTSRNQKYVTKERQSP